MRSVVLGLVPFLVAFSWADLRPDELVVADAEELVERSARGRALLDAAADAHGREAVSQVRTMTGAQHAIAAGQSDSGHQRVFVTWGALEAHADADQYVVYLDPQTGRIDRVSYTIREAHDFAPWLLKGLMKPLAVGTVHFRDVREVGGVWFAHDQIVTLGDGEKSKAPEGRVFHRLTVHAVEFDAVDPGVFRVDPTLPLGSDSKP